MEIITLELILLYLYNFTVSFLFCFIGNFARDLYETYKNITPIRLGRIIISSAVSSILLVAIISYIKLSLPVYTALCLLTGIWSPILFSYIYDSKKLTYIIIGIFKNISSPVTKGVAEGVENIKKEEEKVKNKDINKNKPDG